MSKYTEYYIPVTLLLTEALQNIKELVENDPWNDIGQASPTTLCSLSCQKIARVRAWNFRQRSNRKSRR